VKREFFLSRFTLHVSKNTQSQKQGETPTMKAATIGIHGGYETDPTTKAVAVPIYQTVAYEFDDAQHGADLFNLAVPGNIYTRIMNPTADVLEKRVAELEGGIAGLALSAGSAAINYSILTIAEAGSNIVTVPLLYGGTYTLFAHMLPKQGIEVRFGRDDSPASLEELIDEKTAAVFCETIGNPAGNIVDMAKRLPRWPTSTACPLSWTTPWPRPSSSARSTTAQTSWSIH
jgi:O-acetylhomoserine (thiol)-lyase